MLTWNMPVTYMEISLFLKVFSVTFLEVMLALNQLEAYVYGIKGRANPLQFGNTDPKIIVFERSSLCLRNLAVTNRLFNLTHIFPLNFKLTDL